jgi:uncharacterized protein YecE (DUF72 family)
MRKARDPAAEQHPLIPAGVAWPPSPLRIGISGWNYAGWRGVYYPKGLPHNRELEFASRTFGSIEINGSFYSLQRPSSYAEWYRRTPANFIFSVKGPRFITHMKKLRDVHAPLANFFGSGPLALREKLGPILWQFPPNFGWNEGRFRDFFELLPRTTCEAAELSKHHDEKLKHGSHCEADADRPLQYCVEIRHPTFLVPEFFALLRSYNIAFVFADTAGKWPYAEEITADFVYIRLHGAAQLYVSGYSDSELDWWAARIRKWKRKVREVFVYFDNDAKVHAPFDAQKLCARLGCQGLTG